MTDWASVRYAVVDVEGNGRQPPDPVEVAVVPIVGGVIGEPASWLIRPPRPISPIATRIRLFSSRERGLAARLHAFGTGRPDERRMPGVRGTIRCRELPGYRMRKERDG